MTGSMGGRPKGSGGSMLPPNFVEDRVREKELASLDDASKKQTRVEEEKEEKKVEEERKKIDDLLPEEIESAYGLISYAKFREVYDDVFQGVKDKDHWAIGFVTHETSLPGGTKIKMRNFRRGEGDAIRSLMPRGAMAGGDQDSFYRENARFVSVRVLLALIEFDGKEQTPLPTLGVDNVDDWLRNDNVVQGIRWLDSMPDQVVTYMDAVVNDIMVAYNAAATENLKNQLPPLSHSTA